MPGLPVPHCLPKFAQVHVLSFSDATQPVLYLPMLYTVSIAYKCQSQSNSAHHHPLPPWRLYVCSQHLCLYFVLQIRPSIPFFFLGVMKMTWRKYTQIPVNSKPEGDTYNKNVPFKYFSSISLPVTSSNSGCLLTCYLRKSLSSSYPNNFLSGCISWISWLEVAATGIILAHYVQSRFSGVQLFATPG